MIAGPVARIAGQPALVQLAQNAWANAWVTVRRCFMTRDDVNFNGVLGPAICNLTCAPDGTGDGTAQRAPPFNSLASVSTKTMKLLRTAALGIWRNAVIR